MRALLNRFWTSATLISWCNQGLGLLWMVGILPLMLRYFSPIEVAFWLALNLVIGFGQLGDLGFRTTIIRAYAYFFAGLTALPATGTQGSPASHGKPGAEPAIERCVALYGTSRLLYWILGANALVLAFVAGPVITWRYLQESAFRMDFLVCLVLAAVSVAVYIYSFTLSSLLEGSGRIVLSLKITAIASFVRLVLSLAALWGGAGLVGVVVANLVQQVLLVVLLRWTVANEPTLESMVRPKNPVPLDRALLKELWSPSWRMAGTMGFGYFAYQAAGILAARLLPVEQSASFLLAHRLLFFGLNLSRAPVATSIPRFAQLRALADHAGYRLVFLRKLRLGMIVQLGVVFGTLVLGSKMLPMLGARVVLPHLTVLLLLGLWSLIDAHHNAHASSYFTSNQMELLWPAGMAGLLVLVLGYLLIHAGYGSVGLALAQLLAGGCTVHWRAVQLNLASLDWRLRPYFGSFLLRRTI